MHTIHGGPKTAIIISTVTLSKLLYSDNGMLIVARFKLSNLPTQERNRYKTRNAQTSCLTERNSFALRQQVRESASLVS